MEQAITKAELADIIKGTNGKIFQVTFAKKDGSWRELTGRLGVTRHLKGGVNKAAQSNPNFIVVFDVQAQGYRTVNAETLLFARIGGVSYRVSERTEEVA